MREPILIVYRDNVLIKKILRMLCWFNWHDWCKYIRIDGVDYIKINDYVDPIYGTTEYNIRICDNCRKEEGI